jgi:2,5-furandicarboxylate decarboxylase 1
MSSIYDGGPMITAGVVSRRTEARHQLRHALHGQERNLTGIDIVTPNNMRLFAQRSRPAACPISISIGTHPFEIMGSDSRAVTDEMGIAGGIRGAPVRLTQCETIDMPCIADAEIVLGAKSPRRTHRGTLRRIHAPDGRTALERWSG